MPSDPPRPDPTQAEADEFLEQVHGLTDTPSEPAATAPPVNRDVPYVSGTGTVGSTLTCTMGNWDNMYAEPHSYAYAWSGSGSASGDTYVVDAADAGTDITCVVTATNDLGSTAAPPSNAVTIVAA
jgi:hypothetical protein